MFHGSDLNRYFNYFYCDANLLRVSTNQKKTECVTEVRMNFTPFKAPSTKRDGLAKKRENSGSLSSTLSEARKHKPYSFRVTLQKVLIVCIECNKFVPAQCDYWVVLGWLCLSRIFFLDFEHWQRRCFSFVRWLFWFPLVLTRFVSTATSCLTRTQDIPAVGHGLSLDYTWQPTNVRMKLLVSEGIRDNQNRWKTLHEITDQSLKRPRAESMAGRTPQKVSAFFTIASYKQRSNWISSQR